MDRWALNEEDEWDALEDSQDAGANTSPGSDALAGQDHAGAVTVTVTPMAAVLSVELATGWKKCVDPRVLGEHVVTAANMATAQAMEEQAEAVEEQTAEGGATSTHQSTATDETPIRAGDAVRLVEAVMADVSDFMRRLSEVANHTAQVESAGRHVQGSGKRGQVHSITIDADWCSAVRNSEIESEVLDCLKQIERDTSLGDLASGPQSKNIAELKELTSDPNRLLRRVGFPPQ